jgi:sulfur-oxidizing protein SoxY
MKSEEIPKMITQSLERRDIIKGLGVGAVALTAGRFATSEAYAKASDADALMKKLTGAKEYKSGRISMKLPEIAENGRTVPIAVTVESPMSDKDYVKSIHILAEGNPNPDVISFNLSPASGKASVATRIRLGKTQNIQAAAVMSDGSVYLAKQTIKVTIGGCGG